MREIDIFLSSKKRNSEERQELINKSSNNGGDTDSFMSYGYDYFDNPAYGVGYGGYHYDGRYESAVDKMIDLFSLKKGMKILEVGCAKGYILYEFYKKGFNIAGLDYSRYAVNNSKNEIKESILYGTCTDIPFPDSEFDFVLSKEMLPHIPENQVCKALEELIRVAKNQSVFIEIQVASDIASAELIKKWDNTHSTVKTAAWWKDTLDKVKYEGAINFKELF